MTWNNIKENIKPSAKESIGMHEWKQHKPWCDEECLDFLDQRRQAKRQWAQDPCQSNVDNLNSVRHEVSRHFRKKRRYIVEPKLRNWKLTARLTTLGTCIGALITLRRGTSLDAI
jgi:hypothetical protein